MRDPALHDGLGHPNGSVGHETREASLRVIILSSIGLAVGTFIICAIVWGLFNWFKYHQGPNEALSPMANPAALPPEPRIQVNPGDQLINLRQREEHILNSYAWVDQKAGTVRIPIDKAMDLLAQRGLPTRSGVQNAAGSQAQGSHAPAGASTGTPKEGTRAR